MKRNIIFTVLLLIATIGYSQENALIDKITKQTLEIDSLKNKLKIKQDSLVLMKQACDNFHRFFNTEKSKNKKLQTELATLKDKQQIEAKNLELEHLRKQLKEVKLQADSKLKEQQNDCNQRLEGELKALKDRFVGVYKTSQFDELIASSSLKAVERDRQLFADYTDIQPILKDLSSYFKVLQVLNAKYDMQNVENGISDLKTIQKSSEKVTQLLENLEYYKDYTAELKTVLSKIAELDKKELTGGDEEIQKMKFNKILSVLSDYLYNYKGYQKYLYINAIVRELLERKMGNADADITDLKQKL